MCVCAKLLQPCLTLCDPMDCSLLDSSVHGIPRQEYRSGLTCPPPGDLSNPRIEPAPLTSRALTGRFFTTSATWEARDTDDRVHTLPPPRLGDLETLLKYLVREPMFTRVRYDLGDFKA